MRLELVPRFAFPALALIAWLNYDIKTRKRKLGENLVRRSVSAIRFEGQFLPDETDISSRSSTGVSVASLLHLEVLQPEHALDRCTALVAGQPVPGRQPDAVDRASGLGHLPRLLAITSPDLEGVLARQGLTAIGNPDDLADFDLARHLAVAAVILDDVAVFDGEVLEETVTGD